MLDLSKKRLSRQNVPVQNPTNDKLTVCIEPWADRYELELQDSMEFIFVGPTTGSPELLPYPGELVIYGWDGSEVFVMKDGRLLGQQTSVAEIVKQEFEIARENIRLTQAPWPSDEIAIVHHKFDEMPEFSMEAQATACELVSLLLSELATIVERSNASTLMLWQIADRVIARSGVTLAAPNWTTAKTTLWKKGPWALSALIWKCALSVLPGPFDLAATRKSKRSAKRPSAEPESGPTPR